MEFDLKDFLDEKVQKYNHPSFIETDPIQIPKRFSKKENIEISAFLAATIAWGQRPTIIKNASKLMGWMENDPHDFLMNSSEEDWGIFHNFKHRTFNGADCVFFLRSLKNIYKNKGGLESVFAFGFKNDQSIDSSLRFFRQVFFEVPFLERSQKHIANIDKGSSAKRLNMFLRWMVREDNAGVDFGLWRGIPMSALHMPLDIHTGRQARLLGLLTRKQDDWKAVKELTSRLGEFDKKDPVKYDFALFGLGAFE